MRRLPALVASVLLAQGTMPQISSGQKASLTVEQIAARATPAVVLLRVFDGNGRQTSLGSGFIAPDGRVVTNVHVVEGAERVEVIGANGRLLMSAPHAEALSTTYDIAILPAIPAPRSSLPLASNQPVVGASVVAVGAPEGLTNTVSNGIVSAIRETRYGNWIQISAPLSSGSSGGPVLNIAGEVVGVSVAQFIEGQNLNFAIPASDIRAMIASPPGRLSFPPRRSEASRSGETLGEASEHTRSARKSMIESVPTEALSRISDSEFEIALYGCYGNESGGTIVCVTDFYDSNPKHRVALYRAGLLDAANRGAVADAAADNSEGYRIGNNNNWMPIDGGGTTRAFIRFHSSFAQNGMVRLVLEVGGPIVKRRQAFPATEIQTIRASEYEQRRFFGFP